MPFDLALHTLRDGFTQATRRSLLHRFQHTNFVLNYGTAMPEGAARLREQHRNGFLVHSSKLARMHSDRILELFGLSIEPKQERALAEPSKAAHQPFALDLGQLRARAVRHGELHIALATFVAGSKYKLLCDNHVAHLRRAGIGYYVLVALDTPTLKRLRSHGEPVVDATQLVGANIPAGGADKFGSAAFFAINGARYRALVAMLEARISLIVLDLDVVVLRDPLPWLVAEHGMASGAVITRMGQEKSSPLSFDLLLQSDARDGSTGLESDPDLLSRRLLLKGVQNWTYVNGGTFFCRSTAATVALFRRVWEQLEKSDTPPNEQDALNRELATAPHISWGLLPPRMFPNGFVHFVRPISNMRDMVLIHANWIDGVDEKMYHLRERGLWAIASKEAAHSQERLLSIGDGTDGSTAGRLGFAAHRCALRDALALATALNRTLVLPQLPISRQGSSRTRAFSHFFDYSAFRRTFPRHREHGPDAGFVSPGAVRVHVNIGRSDGPAADGYATVDMPPAAWDDTSIIQVLAPFQHVRTLHLWTAYRRQGGHSIPAGEGAGFEARIADGLRAAPRLRFLVQHVARSIRRSWGTFDCIDAAQDVEYEHLLSDTLQRKAQRAPRQHSTGRDELARTAAIVEAASTLLNRSVHHRVLIVNDGGSRRVAKIRALADRHLEGRAIWMDDHVPPWYTSDFDTTVEHHTHARSFVELQVCARAKTFIGSLASPSTHAVCQLRMQTKSKASRVGRTLRETGSRPRCTDAFGRHLLAGKARWSFF